MRRFLPLIAAGALGALFAGAAVYWAMRTEAAGPRGAGAEVGDGGSCCGAGGGTRGYPTGTGE